MITSLPERPSPSHPYYHSAEKKEKKKEKKKNQQQQTFQGPSNVEKSSNYHSAGGILFFYPNTFVCLFFFFPFSLCIYRIKIFTHHVLHKKPAASDRSGGPDLCITMGGFFPPLPSPP